VVESACGRSDLHAERQTGGALSLCWRAHAGGMSSASRTWSALAKQFFTWQASGGHVIQRGLQCHAALRRSALLIARCALMSFQVISDPLAAGVGPAPGEPDARPLWLSGTLLQRLGWPALLKAIGAAAQVVDAFAQGITRRLSPPARPSLLRGARLQRFDFCLRRARRLPLAFAALVSSQLGRKPCPSPGNDRFMRANSWRSARPAQTFCSAHRGPSQARRSTPERTLPSRLSLARGIRAALFIQQPQAARSKHRAESARLSRSSRTEPLQIVTPAPFSSTARSPTQHRPAVAAADAQILQTLSCSHCCTPLAHEPGLLLQRSSRGRQDDAAGPLDLARTEARS